MTVNDEEIFKIIIGIKKMVLKNRSYPSFQTIKPKNISLNRKPSLPIKLRVGTKCDAKNISDFDKDENGNLIKRFGEEACKWLSSGTNCPFSCSENITVSIFLDPSLDEWLYFLFYQVENPSPLVNKYITCFDGSRVNPIEEAHLVMKKALLESETSLILKEVLKGEEEQVFSWLSSTGSDEKDINNSQISDSERNYYFLSLLNLENEESCWPNSDTESDEFLSSSSCDSSISKLGFHTTSGSSSSSDCVSEDSNFGELWYDEPLVWLSDKRWNLENSFVMSPCRPENEKGYSRVGKNSERGGIFCKTIYAFGSEPLKHINVVCEIPKTISRNGNLLEKCKITEDEEAFLSGKHPIEMFLGLEEFDGQEGIGKELWKDDDFNWKELL